LKLIEVKVVVLEDEEQYLREAFKVSIENKLSIYDSLYILQVIRYWKLLTSDER